MTGGLIMETSQGRIQRAIRDYVRCKISQDQLKVRLAALNVPPTWRLWTIASAEVQRRRWLTSKLVLPEIEEGAEES